MPKVPGFYTNKKLYVEQLNCSKETKELIMNDCVKAFLEENPKLRGIKVTQNLILNRIANFYLDG